MILFLRVGCLPVLGISANDVFVLGLAVAAGACLIGALALLFRSPASSESTEEASTTPSPSHRLGGKPSPVYPEGSEQETPPDDTPLKKELDTTDRVDVKTVGLAPLTSRFPQAEEAVKAESKGEYEKASELWREIGSFLNEYRVLKKANNPTRLAELEMAFERPENAIKQFKEALQQDPKKEGARLSLIYLLLDMGRYRDARELADVVASESEPVTGSSQFFEQVAQAFESAGEIEEAIRYYQLASREDNAAERLAPRLLYLGHLTRLAKEAPPNQDRISKDIIRKALGDSSSEGVEKPSDEVDTVDESLAEESAGGELFKPHEIIVGHLALGGPSERKDASASSFTSSAARIQPGNIVGERPLSAVFSGVDKLYDSAVAIRLTRISTDLDDYLLLHDRLASIAQLNHPNISKIIYSDRFGKVVRVINEYHPGGNLKALVGRLDKLGLPLMLRVLLQIASALDEAHRAGIIHGDLRAENIMLGHDNLIKIVDFALRPWPVRREPTGSDETSPSIQLQELQEDLSQFADIMEYMAQNTIIPPHISQHLNGYDPLEDLGDLIRRAREGNFLSVHYIHRSLLTLLERAAPSQG